MLDVSYYHHYVSVVRHPFSVFFQNYILMNCCYFEDRHMSHLQSYRAKASHQMNLNLDTSCILMSSITYKMFLMTFANTFCALLIFDGNVQIRLILTKK